MLTYNKILSTNNHYKKNEDSMKKILFIVALLTGLAVAPVEAKTAPGANDTLTDDAALKIIQKLAKQGKETAKTYIDNGRQDLADDELAQVAVLEEYLPKPLTEAEIEAAVKEIIAQVGATSMKEMGKVMGIASKQMAGKAEGGVISGIVRRLLA